MDRTSPTFREDFIEHYGVPGMKWGQRKDRRSVTTSKHASSEDHTISRALKAKKNRELSTSELKRLNERLQLESTRSKLDPGKIERGKKATKEILAVGTTIASIYALTQTPLGKKVTAAVKTALEKSK